MFSDLIEYLHLNTNWIFIGPIDHIEADDIIAVSCRYFKDAKEIIICSHDSDLEQCWAIHPGVKIFSLYSKEWKIRPDNYNVYNEIAKKINKEKADNLITTAFTDEELDKRQICVDLTRLPEWVEKIVVDALSVEDQYNKGIYPETIPFKGLMERFDTLYTDTSKIIDYDKQKAKIEKKEQRLKEKKKEEKEKLKRKIAREKKKLLKEGNKNEN
jgi:hypothetical protein